MALFKRGKVWWYEFVFDGERIRESTKVGNRIKAASIEAKRRADIAMDRVGIKRRLAIPTLKEYAENDFLVNIRTRKSEKPKTLAFYENSVKNLLKFDKLAGSRLNEIDVRMIDQFINRRRAPAGKRPGAAVSTVNRELATLRRMFNLVPKLLPGLEVRLPKVELLSGENRRERIVSPDEEAFYLAAADPLLYDVALILFDCGLRPEEAYTLKWPYIRNGNVENYEGKTVRARRSIPATPRVMEMFERRFAEADGEYIFAAPTKSGHIDHSSLKKQHAAAVKESKVEPFVIYSIRHTCITRWAAEGMDPYELMRRAGHADLATTMRYVHMARPNGTITASGDLKSPHKIPHRPSFTLLRGGVKTGTK